MPLCCGYSENKTYLTTTLWSHQLTTSFSPWINAHLCRRYSLDVPLSEAQALQLWEGDAKLAAKRSNHNLRWFLQQVHHRHQRLLQHKPRAPRPGRRWVTGSPTCVWRLKPVFTPWSGEKSFSFDVICLNHSITAISRRHVCLKCSVCACR